MRHLLTFVHPRGAEQFAVVPSVAECLDRTLHRLVPYFPARNKMANRFGADILIQAPDPKKAALFYVNHLGFEITDNNPKMIGLHGKHINLFIEPGPSLGPVLEVTVGNVADAKVLGAFGRPPFKWDGREAAIAETLRWILSREDAIRGCGAG